MFTKRQISEDLTFYEYETKLYLYRVRVSKDSKVLEVLNKSSNTWKVLFWDWKNNYHFFIRCWGNNCSFDEIVFQNKFREYTFTIYGEKENA